MAITVEAVFENGLLKPLQPLPFADHTKLSITIHEVPSWTERTCGMIAWTGTAEELDALIEEAEVDFLEGT